MTSPEYVDYFHALPERTRYRLETRAEGPVQGHRRRADQRDLRPALPEEPRRPGPHPAAHQLRAAARRVYENGTYTLGLRQEEQGKDFDAAHRGPGPGHRLPVRGARRSSRPSATGIRWDEQGRYDVARNYTIDTTGRGIFLQNAGVHTHSITSPDLGMGAYRNAYIIRELLGTRVLPGREVHRVPGVRRMSASGTGNTVGTARACAPSTPSPTPSCCTRWVTHPKAAFWMMQDAELPGRRAGVHGASPPTSTTTRTSGCTTAARVPDGALRPRGHRAGRAVRARARRRRHALPGRADRHARCTASPGPSSPP